MIFDTLDKNKQDLILRYLDLVNQKNKELNLTRIDTKEKGILLHIEDSLTCLPEFSVNDGEFIDIGTGGGFPGVPLAIASGRKGVLIDSIQKKIRAVQEMIQAIGIGQQVEALPYRSEDFALQEGERFDTAVLRAVSSLPVVLELATPLIRLDGEIIALRGRESDELVDEGQKVGNTLGLELVSDREIKIDDEYTRRILVFQKTKKSSVKLPRRNGMAQKRPLTA